LKFLVSITNIPYGDITIWSIWVVPYCVGSIMSFKTIYSLGSQSSLRAIRFSPVLPIFSGVYEMILQMIIPAKHISMIIISNIGLQHML
jgi:hypothetical protein